MWSSSRRGGCSSSRRGGCSSSRRGGFTLLEVLAATVIMAMLYGVLSAKGVEGFALEGDADRRLRASLVADRHLADLEAALAAGLPPAVGTVEITEDEFAVRVDVGPLALPLAGLLPEAEPADSGRGRRDATPSLFTPARGQGAVLLSLRVTVSWHDGLSQRSVERTTFAIDPEAVAATLAQSGLAGATDAQGNPIFSSGVAEAGEGPESR